MIINIGHPRDSDALERALSTTMAEVFEPSRATRSRRLNSLVIASEEPISAGNVRAEGELAPVAAASAARLAPALTGGDVFTDDRAPVEWLIDASIVSYAAEEGG